MDAQSISIATKNLEKLGEPLKISKDVERLFKTYKRYNNDLADLLPNQESTFALIRRHLQWKALKLSGAFALMDCADEINAQHYLEAIRFCEILDSDMEMFERDLNKAPHELLVDFFHTKTLVDGASEISTHDLKKQGFMTSIATPKLKEMISLCAGYDTNSVYSVINEGAAIKYEPLVKTDIINVSYKEININLLEQAIAEKNDDKIQIAKQVIASTVQSGLEYANTTFANLPEMLQQDYAYSPFKFKDGVRRKENLESGTKWVVLDIDDSPLYAEEAHLMLSDINHHIALTSDVTNKFRFRVLLELDSEVHLDSVTWKYFYLKIAEDLGLNADPLPQSQIFYSFKGRDIYSNLDAKPIDTRDYLMYAKDRATDKNKVKPKVMSTAQKRAQLEDVLITFEYAFEAPYGQGSRNMYRMMRHAQDLGATQEEVLELLEDCNNYWDSPMPEERLEKLRDQGRRLY